MNRTKESGELLSFRDEAELLYSQHKSWTEITDILKDKHFPSLTWEQARNKLRDSVRRGHSYKLVHKVTQPSTSSSTLVFGDIHAPFTHPNYLQFLLDTKALYGADEVVCTGDIVDHHALSRFNSEPCAHGAYDEGDKASQVIAQYAKAFPSLKMCMGNHDLIIERQAASVGIGKRFLRTFQDVYGLPDTWELGEEFIIDDVLYKHGLNCIGVNGALNTAIQGRISTVIGHSHSFGGCQYSANPRDIIFGLNAGCGIDISAYAFAYGQHSKYRPTLGCGIVFNKSNAIFVPMGEQYFRN